MRNTTAAGVESAPVLQSASAWVLSRLAVLPARGRMAIRMDTATATAITRRRPTIHPHRPIMHRGVAGILITGATTPAESGFLEKRSPAGDGGVLFLTLALSALSLVSGAVAGNRGTLPHDGAVDRGCELARRVRFDRSHHR